MMMMMTMTITIVSLFLKKKGQRLELYVSRCYIATNVTM